MNLSRKASSLMASGILGLSLAFAAAADPQNTNTESVAPHNTAPPEKRTAVEQSPLAKAMKDIYNVLRYAGEMHLDGKNANNVPALAAGALDGALKTLDPHSAYITAAQMHEMNESSAGKFAGIGIMTPTLGNIMKIAASFKDTPASRAGIQPGDIITGIDGLAVSDIGLKAANEKLSGEAGTPVTLTLLRKGAEHPVTVRLIREVIQTFPVESAVLNDRIGYVRFSDFMYAKTDDRGEVIRSPKTEEPVEHGGTLVRKALLELKRQMGSSAKGYILDLRDNGGGHTYQAQDVADHFLDAGQVVYTLHGRAPGINQDFKTTVAGDVIEGKPLIVMVNEDSASASELVAGALQDHRRAKIMGVTTFGKGTVQQLRPLPNGDFLKLTVAQYLTPGGTAVQGNGVTPDIEYVPLEKDTRAGLVGQFPRESDLPNSIKKGAPSPHKTTETCSPAVRETPTAELAQILVDPLSGKADNMLLCAMEHLLGTSKYTVTTPVPGPN